MDGKKGSMYRTSYQLFQKRVFITLFCCCLISFQNCKNNSEKSDLSFTLIPRNSYFTDSYNDIVIYRHNETRKLLNGYYVVGNKDKKWEEFNVKEGVLNGDYIIFHSNGEAFTNSHYSNGKLNGEEKSYYISGKLKSKCTYKNGVIFGKKTTYFESGQVLNESKIEKEKTIESTTYNIIGEIVSQMFIKDGRSMTQFIKNGKVYSEQISSNYDNFEAMKFFNEDGSLKVYLQMLDEGEKNFIIELKENGDEIKRIDVKKNPQEAMKYFEYLKNF